MALQCTVPEVAAGAKGYPTPVHAGDSISAGYGNECRSEREHYTPRTQNAFMSYGAIAGRSVGAEVRIVAWSGVCSTTITDHLPLQDQLVACQWGCVDASADAMQC